MQFPVLCYRARTRDDWSVTVPTTSRHPRVRRTRAIPRLAILTGAGASNGAGDIAPAPPPLSGQLFDELVQSCPNSWGRLPDATASGFRSDFETAMADLWAVSSAGSSQLLIDMALYFSSFDPSPAHQKDCYSRLLRALKVNGLIRTTAFATLNYECILDVCANRQGLQLAYLGPSPPRNNLLIWKLHGACNLLPALPIWDLTVQLVNPTTQSYYDGPVEPVNLVELRRRYSAGYALPPAMSLFAPGKPTPVATSFIDETRRQWAEWVRHATAVVVIGVRPVLADTHLWQPIISSKAQVWWIGTASGLDYDILSDQLSESRLYPIESLFETSLPWLERTLKEIRA